MLWCRSRMRDTLSSPIMVKKMLRQIIILGFLFVSLPSFFVKTVKLSKSKGNNCISDKFCIDNI